MVVVQTQTPQTSVHWTEDIINSLSNTITPPVTGTVMNLFLILIEEDDIEEWYSC